MKLILEYGEFIADYRPITLSKKGKYDISFNKAEVEKKEKLVRQILNDYYPEINQNPTITQNGTVLLSELLNKSQKNIKILYLIADIMIEKGEVLNCADDIINFIERNSEDLFKVGGVYFWSIYDALKGVSESGHIREEEAVKLFKQFATTKGFDVDVLPPDSKEDDKAGIDAYFEVDEKKYTIQIKTLYFMKSVDDFYHLHIKGDYTPIKTHYLVVMPDVQTSKFNKEGYVFKASGIESQIDETGKSYYLVPDSNLLYTGKVTVMTDSEEKTPK